jgi:hypothetical protein
VSATAACAPARGSEPPASVDFVRDVAPVLTKAGCNAGACHGSFQGRGGLRLSLLGFDPKADYDALAKEARGRRVFPAAPEQSLMLRKATLTMPHGGGRRLDVESDEYRLLRDWISRGLAAPSDATRVARLEVAPTDAPLTIAGRVLLQVRAHWSDGQTREITRYALYESSDDQVATVNTTGQVIALGPGQAAITIRFMGQVAAVSVSVPFATVVDSPAFQANGFIDELINAEWKKLGLKPTSESSDAEFLRRAYIDLVGTLPRPEEVRQFVASADPTKRSKLIDSLLERPEFVEYWSLKWSDLLRVHRRALGEKGLGSFAGWIRGALRENRPADQMVREILAAEGNLYTSGAAAFFYIDQTPQDLAETTAQVFLGVRLQCARCHHHPFEAWSQDDYYGMAAFFAHVRRKDTGDAGRWGGAQLVRLGGADRVTNPATGQPIAPRVLGQTDATPELGADPRRALAQWITARENPMFARNIVNRYWGHFFGRGLVEAVDDLRATNPASHPALLDRLAADFVAHGFDLKHLIRTIAASRVYQLASDPNALRDADGRFVTHHVVRRLTAEVLLDAINQAAETEERFENMPAGTRAISLPDPAVASYFLDTFGRPRRTTACECERGMRPDLAQTLHLANSPAIHQKVTSPQGRVARLIKAGKSDADVVEELYLATFSRPPDADELQQATRLVGASPSRQEGLEDLLWTLVNSSEFVLNH